MTCTVNVKKEHLSHNVRKTEEKTKLSIVQNRVLQEQKLHEHFKTLYILQFKIIMFYKG